MSINNNRLQWPGGGIVAIGVKLSEAFKLNIKYL